MKHLLLLVVFCLSVLAMPQVTQSGDRLSYTMSFKEGDVLNYRLTVSAGIGEVKVTGFQDPRKKQLFKKLMPRSFKQVSYFKLKINRILRNGTAEGTLTKTHVPMVVFGRQVVKKPVVSQIRIQRDGAVLLRRGARSTPFSFGALIPNTAVPIGSTWGAPSHALGGLAGRSSDGKVTKMTCVCRGIMTMKGKKLAKIQIVLHKEDDKVSSRVGGGSMYLNTIDGLIDHYEFVTDMPKKTFRQGPKIGVNKMKMKMRFERVY